VVGGALAIVFGAAVLAVATAQQNAGTPGKAATGIIAALGAGCMLGTMYIPYRKAYISGMNPLSFVTIFTFGELGTVTLLTAINCGGVVPAVCAAPSGADHAVLAVCGRLLLGDRRPVPAVRGQVHRHRARHSALEHQPALGTGVGRAGVRRICGIDHGRTVADLTGSIIMIAGALSISMAEPPPRGDENWNAAMHRECDRYGLDGRTWPRSWAETIRWPTTSIPAVVGSADHAWRRGSLCGSRWVRAQHMQLNFPWMMVLIVGTIIPLGLCGHCCGEGRGSRRRLVKEETAPDRPAMG
jgi:hypothetical protein